jgi:hypothetical protein
VVELVAEAARADERRAHVDRHRDEQVEGHAALVVRHERPLGLVDPLDHEVGLDGDAARSSM